MLNKVTKITLIEVSVNSGEFYSALSHGYDFDPVIIDILSLLNWLRSSLGEGFGRDKLPP